MPLNNTRIQQTKPTGKRQMLRDGDGLFLSVSATGKKSWVLRFSADGRQQNVGLGGYPEVGLAAARKARDRAKEAIILGVDPRLAAHGASSETFEQVAEAWLAIKQQKWSRQYGKVVRRRLEQYAFPSLGRRNIADISPQLILATAERCEASGHIDTAHRVKDYLRQIFDYAKFDGQVTHNPVEGITARMKPRPKQRHVHSIPPKQMHLFLPKLQRYDGEVQTRVAMEIVIRTMVRTNELRFGKWAELDEDVWKIPGERMKMDRDHWVPVVPQVAALFDRLREIAGDEGQWRAHRGTNLRPGADDMVAMSENAMLYALYNMGYKGRATMHGFRSTASTLLNESGRFRADVIEAQLAHVDKNRVRAAYNAAEYMDERWQLMRYWNSWLDQQIAMGELLG